MCWKRRRKNMGKKSEEERNTLVEHAGCPSAVKE
jgi:hypothetical protein